MPYRRYSILKGPAEDNKTLIQNIASPKTSGPYLPMELATIYNFPSGFNGSGQKVAFIELGGGFVQSDLDAFFASFGITAPTVQFVSVNGAQNLPTNANSDDVEVMLDLAVTIGVAPGITPIVYMAPNSIQGFVGAINRAVTDAVNIISISWGAPEPYWNNTELAMMNAAFQAAVNAGISVFTASGDAGASDGLSGLNVDFPGSSPFVTSCGGTTLNASQNTYLSETVWNNSTYSSTGGGLSAKFGLPTYQINAGVKNNTGANSVRRGVPDVAGNADPDTGIIVPVDGANYIVGGTSAVAPLWAGLTAVLNQGLGRNLGFLNPIIYPLFLDHRGDPATPLHDITLGNNNGYTAKSGWDACTGCGSPNAQVLYNLLSSSPTPTPTPTATPTPTPTRTRTPTPTPTRTRTPTPTPTRTRTPTPTPTRTPIPTRTPTPTPTRTRTPTPTPRSTRTPTPTPRVMRTPAPRILKKKRDSK
jgi:kumamolisin